MKPALSFNLAALWGAVKDPALRKPLLLALGVAIVHNLTFANALLYYSYDIFTEADVTGKLVASVGVGVAKLLGVLVSLLCVQKFGRRSLLLFGTVGQLVGLLGLCFGFAVLHDVMRSVVVLTAMIVFIIAWNMSWAPLMWVICSEVLPERIRGVGMGLSIACYWLTSAITNQILLSLVQWLSAGVTFGAIAFTTAAALLFVLYVVPETKDQSLQAIQNTFRSPTSKSKHTARQV